MCRMCAMVDGRSGGSSEAAQPQMEASGGIVAIPVVEDADGNLTVTLSPEQFADLQVQLSLGAAVAGGGPFIP